MRVKVTGKKVTGLIEGTAASYILPGRLEVLPAGGESRAGAEGAGAGRLEAIDGAAPVQLVIRSPKELALAHGLSADQATDDAVQTRKPN